MAFENIVPPHSLYNSIEHIYDAKEHDLQNHASLGGAVNGDDGWRMGEWWRMESGEVGDGRRGKRGGAAWSGCEVWGRERYRRMCFTKNILTKEPLFENSTFE